MFTYTVAQLKNEWEAAMHGTTLDKFANPYDLIYRTARDVMADVDMMEAKRTIQITNAIYEDVNDYQLPSDVKLDAVCDIRPQANRTPADSFVLNTLKQFDKYKALSTAQVDYNTGLKHLRLQANAFPSKLFNDLNGTKSNGLWTSDGAIITAASLTQNQLYSIPPSGGSLQFDISVAGAGYLENSTISPINFSVAASTYNSWVNIASAFLWIYLPVAVTPSSLTSVDLRWGSSNANYYHNSTNTNFWGQGFVNGWNLLKFDWSTATIVGAPNTAAINYARITPTFTGAAKSILVDTLMFKLPSIYELVYYSSLLFQDNQGNWKNAPSADTDILNLEDASINIFFSKLLELSALQVQTAIPLRGKLINFDMESYGGSYDASLKRYKENYKSERLKVVGSYYRNTGSRRGDRFLAH